MGDSSWVCSCNYGEELTVTKGEIEKFTKIKKIQQLDRWPSNKGGMRQIGTCGGG